MSCFKLDPDEAVIMQTTNVITGITSRAELILTNKNIIQVNKNLLGLDKDAEIFPLSSLKVINGKANVLIEKSRTGQKQLELFFVDKQKCYIFNGLFLESKWAAAIEKAHKQYLSGVEAVEKEQSGSGSIIGGMKNVLGSAKNLIPKATPVSKTCKCPKCGAELQGVKGALAKCSYCDSEILIK